MISNNSDKMAHKESSGRNVISCSKSKTPEKAKICAKCITGFRLLCTLKRHLQCHSGEKPHSCPDCEQEGKQQVIAHTNIGTDTIEIRCRECKKYFSRKCYLELHMKFHSRDETDECEHENDYVEAKPYPCTECKKSFLQKSSLTRHMRTHRSEKSHTCDVCGKLFLKKDNLEQHARMHVKKSAPSTEVNKLNSSNSRKHIDHCVESTVTKFKPSSTYRQYTCPNCRAMYFELSSFQHHLTVCNYQKLKKLSEVKLRQCQYHCPNCNIVISELSRLQKHIEDCYLRSCFSLATVRSNSMDSTQLMLLATLAAQSESCPNAVPSGSTAELSLVESKQVSDFEIGSGHRSRLKDTSDKNLPSGNAVNSQQSHIFEAQPHVSEMAWLDGCRTTSKNKQTELEPRFSEVGVSGRKATDTKMAASSDCLNDTVSDLSKIVPNVGHTDDDPGKICVLRTCFPIAEIKKKVKKVIPVIRMNPNTSEVAL